MQNFSLKKFVISKITTNFAVSYYKTKCLTGGNSTIFRNNGINLQHHQTRSPQGYHRNQRQAPELRHHAALRTV